jgi:Ca2+-binding RTX toxin-like protein
VLTVNNVAPSVANAGNVAVSEGASAANTGTWSDPGLDIVTLSASVGSVTKNAIGTWSWSFNTSDGPDETQDVTITATDSDGASSTTTFHLTVNNVAPSVANNGNVTVNAGTTATNTGTWSDPGLDVVTLTASVGTVTKNANGNWSWSLGTSSSTPSQTVTITATDSDNAASTTTFTLTVNSANNVAPVITAISNSSPDCGGVFQGESVSVSASFTDANAGDSHTATINWGDGTTSAGTVTVSSGSVAGSHVYATGGFYTITVTVSDGSLSDVETTSSVIAGVGLHGGVLYIIGTNGKDVVHVNATCGDRLNVHANFDVGRRHRGNCDEDLEDDDWSDDDEGRDARKGAEHYRFKVSDVTRIEMRLCGGDDVGHVTRRVKINALIDGEDGDDKLRGGGGNDTVRGGSGDDKLWAATGNDLLDGGDGNDKLFGGQGSDTLLGGRGNDQIRADGGADSISGGDGNDVIFAGRGNDTIDGGAGDDDIHEGCGGGGSDLIYGGSGNDTIRAGRDGDVIDGGTGDDLIYGGQGADSINGGDGNDTIRAGNGNDTVFAGAGDDSVEGGQGDDYLDLGAGNDTADGGNGDDIILGRDGNDVINGGQGRDLLIGGLGADKLTGNADEDVLIAGNTSYDGNQSALLAIMAEWTSNKTYAVRLANLLNGTGLTNGNKLDGNDGATQTVFADADIDTLTGSQGTDAFWANLVADNGGAIDVLTDKASNETASDIDL